ncbi:MAG: hypothetical protein OEM59_17545 [Rhodospirillales bacterium]|nr:hypothetical protein [Rhodospirillales bacterium]
MTKPLFLCALVAAFLLAGPPGLPRAKTPALPSPDEVFAIAIKPQARQLPEHFTPESLLQALPRLKPAYVMEAIGGKIWSQSGVIVLESREVLFWRSYKDELLLIETGGAPVIYVIDR